MDQFSTLVSARALLDAVPEANQLRVLRHIVYCVHQARGDEVEFDCVLADNKGREIDVRLVMLCERASGAFVVGILVN